MDLLKTFLGNARDGSGIDDWISENNGKVGLAGAAALAFADGDDGMTWGAIEFMLDTWALNSVASGDPSILAKLWLAKRATDILPEDAGWTTTFMTGIGSYFGMGQWQGHWENSKSTPKQETQAEFSPSMFLGA